MTSVGGHTPATSTAAEALHGRGTEIETAAEIEAETETVMCVVSMTTDGLLTAVRCASEMAANMMIVIMLGGGASVAATAALGGHDTHARARARARHAAAGPVSVAKSTTNSTAKIASVYHHPDADN